MTLRWPPGRLELCVADDGKGFDVGNVRKGSLGLGIMRERASAIGAALDIRSSEDGTEVTVVWPAAAKEDAA